VAAILSGVNWERSGRDGMRRDGTGPLIHSEHTAQSPSIYTSTMVERAREGPTDPPPLFLINLGYNWHHMDGFIEGLHDNI
jgi:hypothetical protein